MSLTSGTRLGAYQITGLIGVGGMGEVYRASDTKLGRNVAIKTLPSELAKDPDRLARFERGYSTLSFAFASASVCHCMFEGSSGPPRLSGIT